MQELNNWTDVFGIHSKRRRGSARQHGVNPDMAGSWPVALWVLAKLSDYGSAVRHFESFLSPEIQVIWFCGIGVLARGKWSRNSCRKTNGMRQLLHKICFWNFQYFVTSGLSSYRTTGKTAGYSGVRRRNAGCVKLSRQISSFAQQWFKWQTSLNNWTTKVVVT